MSEPTDPGLRRTGGPDAATFGDAPLRETLAWVLDSLVRPATAAGDWIAYEIDPSRGTAVALLTDPTTPPSRLRRARVLYAAQRADGESAAERALASRLAVACAAAAYLFHDALLAALRSTAADETLDPALRDMVDAAARRLQHEMR
jgi:hypothetical protein